MLLGLYRYKRGITFSNTVVSMFFDFTFQEQNSVEVETIEFLLQVFSKTTNTV